MNYLYHLRCSNCGKLLGYIQGRAIIKCSRCSEEVRHFSEWNLSDVDQLANSGMSDEDYSTTISELIASKSA